MEVATSGLIGAGVAVSCLCDHWRNDKTRDMLTEVAKSGLRGAPKAVSSLALQWRDATSRGVLMKVATTGLAGSAIATCYLSRFWRDSEIFDLLRRQALNESYVSPISLLMILWRGFDNEFLAVETWQRSFILRKTLLQELKDFLRFSFGYFASDLTLLSLLVRAIRAGLLLSRQTFELFDVSIQQNLTKLAPEAVLD